jgi:hypothetical protein
MHEEIGILYPGFDTAEHAENQADDHDPARRAEVLPQP